MMALSVLLYSAPFSRYRRFCARPQSAPIATKLSMPTLAVFFYVLSKYEGAVSKAHSVDHVFVQLIFIVGSYSPSGPQHHGAVRFSKHSILSEISTFLWLQQ